jgi:hypothetical protein
MSEGIMKKVIIFQNNQLCVDNEFFFQHDVKLSDEQKNSLEGNLSFKECGESLKLMQHADIIKRTYLCQVSDTGSPEPLVKSVFSKLIGRQLLIYRLSLLSLGIQVITP